VYNIFNISLKQLEVTTMTKNKKSNREFLDLQNKWYKKLKRSGFEDIEWTNPKTGRGQNSPYLKAGNSVTSKQMRSESASALQQHYRLCRNFLANGPFYTNCKDIFKKNREKYAKFRTFKAFSEHLQPYHNKAAQECWRLYCDGFTIRKISDALRSLHRQWKLSSPKNRWGASSKGEPYSTFWVAKKIDELKVDCIVFNISDPEGLLLNEDSEAIEAVYADPTFEAAEERLEIRESLKLKLVSEVDEAYEDTEDAETSPSQNAEGGSIWKNR